MRKAKSHRGKTKKQSKQRVDQGRRASQSRESEDFASDTYSEVFVHLVEILVRSFLILEKGHSLKKHFPKEQKLLRNLMLSYEKYLVSPLESVLKDEDRRLVAHFAEQLSRVYEESKNKRLNDESKRQIESLWKNLLAYAPLASAESETPEIFFHDLTSENYGDDPRGPRDIAVYRCSETFGIESSTIYSWKSKLFAKEVTDWGDSPSRMLHLYLTRIHGLSFEDASDLVARALSMGYLKPRPVTTPLSRVFKKSE